MVNEHRLEVCAQKFNYIAVLLIAQPEVDDVLGLDGIDMLKTLVEVFKVLAIKA